MAISAFLFLFCTFHTRIKTSIKINAVSSLESSQGRREQISSETKDAKLLYEDEDLLVYDKPHNLLSVAGADNLYNLATSVAEQYKIECIDHMIAHRLDYATSGVIVFARNKNSLSELHAQFRSKRWMFKQYTAIIDGIPPTLEGEIDLPIGRDPLKGPPYFCIDTTEYGKRSQTQWTVTKRTKDKSYLQLRPYTGRTHQLRLHMAALGHPILGDFFYAPDDIYYSSPRLMLHAEYLGLKHPRTKQDLLFHAKCSLLPYLDDY